MPAGTRIAMNISVIVPVLNEEKTIGAALTALSQLAPYEIIVVDGGSGDRTGEICRQFGVKLISSERGRARQMNHGARQASGEVLLFLHADTLLPQSAFADIAAALRRTALSRRAFRCRARRTPPDA